MILLIPKIYKQTNLFYDFSKHVFYFSTLAREYSVRVGSSSSQNGGELIPAGDLTWHSNFTYSKMDSDVALIWLSSPLTFNERVAPIDMFDLNEEIPDGDITMVSGWGNLRVCLIFLNKLIIKTELNIQN